SRPSTIGLDPLPSGGRRIRQRQLENRDRLSFTPSVTDRDDVAGCGDVDLPHSDGRTEHEGLEGTVEVLVERRVKADRLLGFRVRIDDSFLDHGVESAWSDSAPGGTRAWLTASAWEIFDRRPGH